MLDPCYTTIALPEDANGQCDEAAGIELLNYAAENDVIAFGPGAGTGRGVQQILLALMEAIELPLIVDADGLNVLAAVKNIQWVT